MSQTFQITGADGQTIQVPAGEFYFNTKARARRMMLDSLSSDARRVYACLELATMGFQREDAVVMDRGRIRPMTPGDVSQQTGLDKQRVRRGLEELENEGLAKRESDNGKGLHRGHVRLYSWVEPHPTVVNIKKVARAGYFPSWFPESWEPFRPLINRFKMPLITDEVVARDYFNEGERLARDYQNAEMVALRFLNGVCARERINKEERTKRTIQKQPSSSAFTPNGENHRDRASKAEDEESSYQKFKAKYPTARFDEPKAKASFNKKTKAQQTRILERLEIYLGCERWTDEGGRWIPLASNWLESYEAEPPPRLAKPSRGRRQASTEEVVEHMRMQDEFDKHANEINEILREGRPLPADLQILLDHMLGRT